MRLLFLYIESYRCVRPEHPLAINFTSDYRFRVERSYDGQHLLCEAGDCPLPSDFFSVIPGENAVAEVSAVVGKNGAGKTTLASFLQRMRMSNARKNNFLVVYEVSECKEWRCVSTISNLHYPRGGDAPKSGYAWSESKLADYVTVEESLKNDFDYVYYSPYYTIQNAFDFSDDPSCVNLSTSALLLKRPEFVYNKSVSKRDEINFIQRGYATEQKLWALNFAAEYVKWSVSLQKRIDISAPRIVLMKADEDMDEVSTEVLLEYARGDRLGFTGIDKYSLKIYKEAVEFAEQLRAHTSDFVAAAFRVFLLNYFRNVHIEEEKRHAERDQFGLKLVEELPAVLAETQTVAEWESVLLGKLSEWRQLPSAVLNPEGVASLYDFFKIAVDHCARRRASYSVEHVANLAFEQEHFSGMGDLQQLIIAHGKSTPVNGYVTVKFDPAMSSGEAAFLSMFSRLNWYFKTRSDPKKDVLLFLDEAETTLHPTWQCKLVQSLILFLNQTAPTCRIHVVFATHSPMLLSDIPSGNAVFLRRKFENERDRKGAYSEQVFTLDADLGFTNTFGANVMDLFGKSFFLEDGTIGAFARTKIQQAIDGKIPQGKSVVGLIGDSFLRMVAEDSLGR